MRELLKQATVLYVEDEEEIREKIGLALGRRVGKLYLASNGQEGLELCLQHKPHIVVTDLEMPVLDGLGMIKKIREAFNRTIPIVVITAYQDEDHFTDLADSYIFKPVIIRELEETLNRLIHDQGLLIR